MANEAQPWEATGAAPPIVYTWARPMAWGGFAAVAIGAIIGNIADAGNQDPMAGTHGVLAALRAIFAVGGIIAVGLAVSLRPTALMLVLATATGLLAHYADAFHADWDSARMLAGFLAVLAGTGAIIRGGPELVAYLFGNPSLIRPARRIAITALLFFHFGSLCVAVTAPGAQPWIGAQFAQRVYRCYQQSMYLTNAYHFYSPEPGPAYMLWFCVYYDNDDPAKTDKAEARWVSLPKRPEDMMDPLAITYYRRLSITATAFAPSQVQSLPDDVTRARYLRTQGKDGIPLHPQFSMQTQYLMPQDNVRVYMLPAFVKHLAHSKEAQHGNSNVKIKWIKVYMVEHSIVTPADLEIGMDFYDAPTYKPYFMGEFDTEGNLRDPNDPMLYWMLPILFEPKHPPIPSYYTVKNHPEAYKLFDGVEKHCGFKAPVPHYWQDKEESKSKKAEDK
ncbi:MAG TPA: hypothetical protein VKS79_02915 [Gemmataceae bacterium]|nr:hypothetical protein [Gemmataceae bacterium]